MNDRLIDACRMVIEAPGPITQKAAIRNLREIARQLDQEENPCPAPSQTHSDPSSTSPNDSQATSDTTPQKSANGSHVTPTRTRTIKPAPATKPATPATRRRTP